MDIEIKKISPADISAFTDLISIFEEVFEMDNFNMPDRDYLKGLLSKPDFFALAARKENKVVGGLTVYILHHYYFTKPIAYIYDLGVSAAFQRRGIGKSLINYLADYCKENGYEEAYVQAETKDTDAVSFYRSTSYSCELQATHFTYSFGNASTEKKNP